MKQLIALALALCATPAFAQTAPRPPDAVLKDLEATHATEGALLIELKAAIKPVPVADATQLAAALALGGDVYLKPNTDYPGTFIVSKRVNLIAEGVGSRLTGSTTGPAVKVTTGGSGSYFANFTYTSANNGEAFVIGTGAETTAAETPTGVTLRNVRVESYRGKRALAVHGRAFTLVDSWLVDIYSPTKQDSQAVWIGNAPCRPCTIDHNELSAGSEILLVGGATMAIPDVHPADIRITRNHLFRPESWRTDGVERVVKNLIELKDGEDVLIAENTAEGVWTNGQDGPAIVLTSKSGGNVQRVTIEHNRITRAGYGVQMLAADYHADAIPTPALLSGVIIRQNVVEASTTMGFTSPDGLWHGSRGILALVLGGVRDVTIDDNTAITDGGSFVVADSRGSYLGLDGVLHPNPPIGRLSVTNNRLVAGAYGVILAGAMTSTATPPRTDIVDVLTISGNTIAGGSAWLKKYFPTNTYVTRAELDALVAAQ